MHPKQNLAESLQKICILAAKICQNQIECLWLRSNHDLWLQVRGDVFVARVFDNEEEFQRLDFKLAELSSSAEWIKQAAAQNEKKRKVSPLEA